MKLQTTIRPRKDSAVNATGPSGRVFRFMPDGGGVLTCDVDCDATVLHLLSLGGDFFPANEADLGRAELMLRAGGDDDSDASDELDSEADDDASDELPPVEAGTPPVSRKSGRKAK